jgi:acyl-CoA-binding protein
MQKKDLEKRFEKAVELALTIPQSDLPQDVQLRCYAYYKQATSGSISSNANYNNLDLRNAFKTNAWLQISHLSINDAKELYIETINALHKK